MNGAAGSFLGSEFPDAGPDALFHLLPVPYEATVSYGGGTSRGPEAIIAASNQLEIFDGHSVPGASGIHTHVPVECAGQPEHVFAEVAERVSNILELGKVPVLLGGEHSVTNGALIALQRRRDMAGPVGIVQFDAHDDLRDAYEGSRLSHASVMRRTVEMGFPLCQVGVRAHSPDCVELRSRGTKGLSWFDSEEIVAKGTSVFALAENFPEQVYVTLDLDVFDSGLMPATGTPEPGGLGWWDVMRIVEKVCATRRVIGFDVVELAPIEGLHSCEYMAARCVYNLMGYIERSR